MGWIDSHVHVWVQDADKYPVPKDVDVSDYDPPNFLAEDILKHAKPAGVDRVVLVQIGTYASDNRLMIHCRQQHPDVFSIIGMIDRDSPRLIEEMEELKGQGVLGFRIAGTPGDPEKSLQSPGYDQLFEAAVKTGQSICPLTMPDGHPDLVAICERHPDTTVVIDHMTRMGERSPINDDEIATVCSMSKLPNVYVKISRLHALGDQPGNHDDLLPMIRKVIDAFGPERLLWGSDAPYQVVSENYEDSLSVVRDKLGLSDADRDQILFKTAEKLFYP
jgi:predicted TIM-barrel fold metal-dependent hydrolase